jgi:hypothetical protein
MSVFAVESLTFAGNFPRKDSACAVLPIIEKHNKKKNNFIKTFFRYELLQK